MSSIYISVCQTQTNVARFIKLFTRKPYNHVSVSTCPKLSEMYSFCRNKPGKPLPATFNAEEIGKGTLGKFSNIPCEIYRLEVTEKQKKLLSEQLEYFKRNRDSYSYNCIGLALIFFHIAKDRKNKFVCSQFVGHIMEEAQINLDISKPVSLYTPEDFRHIKSAELIYKGDLNQFNNSISQMCNLSA
ncbi:MAG: hypothetical protein IJA12_03335 [Oscillospiraceae bacterium]|nr:hypothetical protein [Oscillospiraceae bacterium]